MDEILSNINTKMSEESRRTLADRITEGEIRDTIRKTTSEKAPGPDGIPIEIWKSLDDQATKDGPAADRKCNIVWVLSQVFHDIEEYGVAEGSDFHEGCMNPIYKKKDPDNIANYRPITLLNQVSLRKL